VKIEKIISKNVIYKETALPIQRTVSDLPLSLPSRPLVAGQLALSDIGEAEVDVF
jgi:hypothetical protein